MDTIEKKIKLRHYKFSVLQGIEDELLSKLQRVQDSSKYIWLGDAYIDLDEGEETKDLVSQALHEILEQICKKVEV